MDYDKDVHDDAVEFIEMLEDEIKNALINGTEFSDIDEDLQCRMDEHVDAHFTLADAAYVIDYSDNVETDAGLWEGLDPSDAIIAMAEYSNRADVWFAAEELYEEMLAKYEEEDDGARFDKIDMADMIWNEFVEHHTTEPVDTGGITELTILKHWIKLNENAGMWNGYPLGGAYIDARCGAGYDMPEVKNFVDCDRTTGNQLPHMQGKYNDAVRERIDELEAANMTDSEKHHVKLDEIIEDARKYMHGMMDSAMLSGALSHDMEQPHSYFLSRAIITIYGDDRPHAPPGRSMMREIENLAKVL